MSFNVILSVFAPFMITAVAFIAAVASGAARDSDLVRPINPLAAMLVALILLTIQAVLWVRVGARF